MRTSRFFSSSALTLALLLLSFGAAHAADPGLVYPDSSAISDQKAGSVLIFPVYSSSATNASLENTRITITNTSSVAPIGVHLFFVDGALCSPADNVLCLTQNQTATFRASDFDPGTTGYIIAIAVDNNGCPVRHNFLIGEEFIKFASGHSANLGAEAIAALVAPFCADTESTVTLNFNGSQYNRLPATVAIDNLPSAVDGNSTRVIISRPTGNLAVGTDPIGGLFGILYNDAESPYSYQLTAPGCQLSFIFSNSTPRLVSRFTTVVPAGRTGWTRLYATSGAPLIGAVFNFNAGAAASGSAFNGGHNLHKLTFAPSSSLVVPVFQPNCSILN